MGFMEGFGQGFANTFNAKQAQDAAAERDDFAMAYNAYMDKQKQWDADVKADAAAHSQAKTIVQSLGLSPAAAGEAYKLIRAGYSISDVEKKLTSVKFAEIPKAVPADGAAKVAPLQPIPGTDGQPIPSPVNSKPATGGSPIPGTEGQHIPSPEATDPLAAQTQASGLGSLDNPDPGPDTPNVDIQTQSDFAQSVDPTLDQSAPNPNADPTAVSSATGTGPTAAPDNGLLGNLANNVMTGAKDKMAELGNPALKRQHQIDAANGHVAAVTGTDPAHMKEVMAGYTPPEPNTGTFGSTTVMTPKAVSPFEEFFPGTSPLTSGDLARTDAEAAINLKSDDPELKAKGLRYLMIRPALGDAVLANSPEAKVDAEKDPSSSVNIMKLLSPYQTELQKLGTDKADVLVMKDSMTHISKLLEKNGALNTWAVKGLTEADNLKTQTISAVNALMPMLESNPELAKDAASVEGYVNDWAATNLPGWKQMSSDERAFSAEVLRLQYMYSRTVLGQTGNGQTDKDITNVKDIIMNSPDPKEAVDQLKHLLSQAIDGYNYKADTLLNQYGIASALKLDKTGLVEASVGKIPKEAIDWAHSATPDATTPSSPDTSTPKPPAIRKDKEIDAQGIFSATDLQYYVDGGYLSPEEAKKLENKPYIRYKDGTVDY